MNVDFRAGDLARDLAWIFATTIGLSAGGFVFHFSGSSGGWVWDPAAIVFGAILGFVTGAAVGLIQWACLLVRRRSGLRLVVLWMGFGIAVTHGLQDGAPSSVWFVPTPLVYGAGMAAGYAAWLGDRRPIPLLCVGLGWTGSLVVAAGIVNKMGLPTDYTGLGWATRHAVEGILAGVAWGVATVIVGVPAYLRTNPSAVRADFVASHLVAR